MTPGIHCCRDDDDLAKAVQHMEKLKVRRLPVINKSKPVLQKRGIRLGTRIEKNHVFGSVDMLGKRKSKLLESRGFSATSGVRKDAGDDLQPATRPVAMVDRARGWPFRASLVGSERVRRHPRHRA